MKPSLATQFEIVIPTSTLSIISLLCFSSWQPAHIFFLISSLYSMVLSIGISWFFPASITNYVGNFTKGKCHRSSFWLQKLQNEQIVLSYDRSYVVMKKKQNRTILHLSVWIDLNITFRENREISIVWFHLYKAPNQAKTFASREEIECNWGRTREG